MNICFQFLLVPKTDKRTNATVHSHNEMMSKTKNILSIQKPSLGIKKKKPNKVIVPTIDVVQAITDRRPTQQPSKEGKIIKCSIARCGRFDCIISHFFPLQKPISGPRLQFKIAIKYCLSLKNLVSGNSYNFPLKSR